MKPETDVPKRKTPFFLAGFSCRQDRSEVSETYPYIRTQRDIVVIWGPRAWIWPKFGTAGMARGVGSRCDPPQAIADAKL